MAYFGTFGYELDLNLLSDEELKQVKEQVAFMKKYRKLIQVDGDFYRLLSPFKGNETAWMVVSQDKKQAIAAFYQRLNKVNASWLRFRLQGLDKDMLYEIKCEEKVYQAYGDELMYAGIPIDRERLNKNGGDFASLLFVLQEAER